MPLVSVLLPVYNGAAFVRGAIESVLAQTFTDFEFIIVDNASTDGTDRIIAEYSDDPRVRSYRNEETIFRLENFMRVADHASSGSRWLKYIGADDILFPDCLDVYKRQDHRGHCQPQPPLDLRDQYRRRLGPAGGLPAQPAGQAGGGGLIGQMCIRDRS